MHVVLMVFQSNVGNGECLPSDRLYARFPPFWGEKNLIALGLNKIHSYILNLFTIFILFGFNQSLKMVADIMI